jgi:DNA-binding GntR family transcriptional regulator
MSTSLYIEAYEKIKELIVTTKMPPGSIIDEKSLIKDLNLGRTPIHSALNRLALEQLVEIAPRRGTFVSNIDIMDVPRIFEYRTILEVPTAGLAVQRATDEQIQEMEEVIIPLKIPSAELDNRTFINSDRKFHHLIYVAANNKYIQESLDILYAQIERIWFYYSLQNTKEFRAGGTNHFEILDAIKNRDEEAAKRLMFAHTAWLQAKIISTFQTK